MAFEHAEALPCLQIPKAQSSIKGGGEPPPLVGAPSYVYHLIGMAFEHAEALPCLQIPQAHSSIIGGGERPPLAGAQCNGHDHTGMALEHAHAFAAVYVPQPHGPTEVARDGTLSVWCQRVGPYLTLVVKLGGLFSELSARGWRFLDGRCRWSAASSEELRIFLAAVRRQPTDVQKLRQRAFGGGIVEAQGNEAALLVQRVAKAVCAGFQLCPVGTERVSRHAEHEHTGVL